MKHYYENVPRLGNVAVSRHAQSQMLDAGIWSRLVMKTDRSHGNKFSLQAGAANASLF